MCDSPTNKDYVKLKTMALGSSLPCPTHHNEGRGVGWGLKGESGAKSRNKQGESREPGRVESGINEARVGKQAARESGNTYQSRETWTKETCDFT